MRRSPLLDTSSVRHRRRDHNDIWRITDGDGTALEESDEFFLTITAALAGGRCRLAVREQRDAARLRPDLDPCFDRPEPEIPPHGVARDAGPAAVRVFLWSEAV